MIQIDMPMPKSCIDCPICNDYMECAIPINGRKWAENDVTDFSKSRPEWCPLKEQEAVSPYQFEDIWKCGNCGDGIVAYEELGVSGIEEVKFNYCPTCGRRVLWGGR